MSRKPTSPVNHPGDLEDHNWFRAPIFRWLHWPGRPPLRRWTWVKVWALGSMAGMSFALFQVQQNYEHDQQRAVDQGFSTCLGGNDVRTAMADVVRVAYTTGVSVDFTKVPGFDGLPAATRAYFQNFQDQIDAFPDQSADPDSKLNQSLVLLALRDCEAEFPTHTAGIRAPRHDRIPAAVTTSTTGDGT